MNHKKVQNKKRILGYNLNHITVKFYFSLFTVLFFISCGVQKNIVKDPYVGSYEMTVFEVDNFGDIPLFLDLTKEGDQYKAAITPQEGSEDVAFEVEGTTFDEGTFTVEAYAAGYDIYFELTIEEDTVTGSLMGMFDLEGSRIKN